MSDNPPRSPSQRLALILDGLRKVCAAHASRNWALAPVTLVLWSYLNRVAARFERLSLRISQGRLRKPLPRAAPDMAPPDAAPDMAQAEASASPPKPARPRKPQLPKTFGWLGRWGWDVRCHGSQLRHLLCQPEMRELMEASPQAGRILRPLCRMLGIEPWFDLPPSLYPPRPERPKPVRVAKPPVLRVKAARPARRRARVDPANWWLPKFA